jgi:uncharacterized FlgJ-related protein
LAQAGLESGWANLRFALSRHNLFGMELIAAASCTLIILK